MKVTYRWLKDYVDFSESAFEIADKLTHAGFEVEEIHPMIQPFTGVVVGEVVEVEKHPDADKLSVCKVRTAEGEYQVICGAPNVAQGQFVPFAQVGAVLPGGFKIKKAKIRGVESFGMICSKEELGLEKQSDGIWAFEQPMPLGEDVHALLSKEEDYLFDFFITPNRPDCLSVVGIAREIAALTGNTLRLPQVRVQEQTAEKIDDLVSIKIHDPEGCPRYAARIIRGVKLAPSPEWMQRRLEAVGVRPINNIVDITNYVLMELGHPLHAFDLAQIKGPEINVRSSEPGEKFTTLDEKERELPANTVMICDRDRAVAIGGIMGGLNSEVSDTTKDILLESAYFNPERVAFSSKKLGLSTEASQRFERGADPNGVLRALDRAAQLMAELAGGTIVTGVYDVYPRPIKPQEIPFRPERINRVLGSDFSRNEIARVLESIELKIENDRVIAPTFRPDLKQEIDLAEEVARLIGFANLPTRKTTEMPYEIPEGKQEKLNFHLRSKLLELGLQEAFTNSMLKEKEAEPFRQGQPVRIMNPISDDMTTMRPSLLPGLLKAVTHNVNRNLEDVRFFELGRVFQNYRENQLPEQPYHLAVVITGRRYRESWNAPKETVDFYDIKGYLENFLAKIFLDNYQFILYPKATYLSAEECIAVEADGEILGVCGRIQPDVLKAFDLEKPVYGFELNVDKLAERIGFDRSYQAISRFPYSERDLALVLDDDIHAADVLDFIRKISGNLLYQLDVFDVYRGDKIPAGKKSLAIRMRFQSHERTLSDKEVDKLFNKIIQQSQKKFNARLRD